MTNVQQVPLIEETKTEEDNANPSVKSPSAESIANNCELITTNSDKSTSTLTMHSESEESLDIVERSEQALLQLCIKTGSTTNECEKQDSIIEGNQQQSDSKTEDKEVLHCDAVDGQQTHQDEETLSETLEASSNPLKKVQEDEYRRQRDPDAMIASLDRLTATLVQQTEAMRERDSMKRSVLSDTFNEDSPNDVTFPSISLSAPFVASFKSDAQEPTISLGDLDGENMSNSIIIQREAIKLAEAVSAEQNWHSLGPTSLDLDNIRPPSAMGSLVSMTSSLVETATETAMRDRCNSSSLPIRAKVNSEIRTSRKISLPSGVVAKRAIAHGIAHSHSGSLESLLNECNAAAHSQLENVKPPSMMDEVFDGTDMENSMVSVASIVSEIADNHKEHQGPHSMSQSDPVFDTLIKPMARMISYSCKFEPMNNSQNNSISDCLDNINPPSFFNEVTELDDSTMEANSNTMCSDTLCIDVDFKTEEISRFDTLYEADFDNETDEATTPLSTEYCLSSSAESSPKKRLNLTPKQKRQLAKERYKTYTIAGEIVKKEEEERRKREQQAAVKKSSPGKCSPYSKLTPKQRRKEDRARFQTQVLNNPFGDGSLNATSSESQTTPDTQIENIEDGGSTTPVKSAIPKLRTFSSKTFKKRRSEDKDRYQTRTLNGSELNWREEDRDEIVNVTLNVDKNGQMEADLSFDYGDYTVQDDRMEIEENDELLTYTIIDRQPTMEERNSDSDSDEEKNAEENMQGMKRPRIVKPGCGQPTFSSETNVQQESPKGIRGRRRALYSNPITRKSTPQTSPLKQRNQTSAIPIGRSHSSPAVRSTRTTNLRKNSNSPAAQKESPKFNVSPKHNNLDKKVDLSKRTSIPQKSFGMTFTRPKRHSTPPNYPGDSNDAKLENTSVRPLERQGTFTKDEPEVDNAPTVCSASSSPSRSRIGKPVTAVKSKISCIRAPKSYQNKITRTVSPEKIEPSRNTQTYIVSKRTSGNRPFATALNAGGDSKLVVRKEIPKPLAQRSNSNSSITSNGAGKKPTKEATSKIASLWKKVEENRGKQQQQQLGKKDTRQWITAENPSEESPTHKIVRSSTFDGLSQAMHEEPYNKSKLKLPLNFTDKNRNSCDLSGASTASTPSCKIPVKSMDFRNARREFDENQVIFRRQISLDERSTQSEQDPEKRSSRLNSFFRVESQESNAGQVQHNGRAPASAIVPPFNYNPKQGE